MSNRVSKSLKNMRYGIGYQIIYLVFNFIVRLSIIKVLGVTALSLNGLFLEVLGILSLAEMGVGTAIVYSLYKPLAEEDHKKIAQLMNLFKKAYHLIALAIFVIGLILIPFLPKIVTKVDVSHKYLVLIYILFLLQTCVSYINSYKALLLTADQKAWVQAKTNIVIRSLFFLGSLCIIYLTKNFVLYVLNEMLYSLSFYYVVGKKVDKLYPYLNPKEKLSKEETKEIFNTVRQTFVSKLSNKILNSTDNILISMLVGTNLVGIYSQYSMFINGFLRLFSQFNEAIVGSIGNLIAVETKEKTEKVLNRLNYLFFVFGSLSSVCLFVGINPFLKSVVGKEFLLENKILLMVTVNMFFEILKMPLWTYFDAAGLFRYNQKISLMGCAINLIFSIVLGKKVGMFGIFVGTFISLFYMIVHKIIILEQVEFFNKNRMLIKNYIKYAIIFSLELFAVYHLFSFVFDIGPVEFLVKTISAGFMVLVVTIVFFIKTEESQYFLDQVSAFVRKKCRS